MKKQYQLAVVGAGSGGREAALVAAKEGLNVLLVEKDTLGGTPVGFEKWLTVQRRVSARLTQEVNNQLEKAGVAVRFANASLTAPNQLTIARSQGEGDQINADYT